VTTVVILQSNYVPWRGYFDLIRKADDFVFYDTVQFTKNDWRNRNRIVTPTGPVWLTVPVATSGQFGQTIETVRVSDPRWASRHLKTLQSALGNAPCFRSQLKPRLDEWFAAAAAMDRLSAVNQFLVAQLMQLLGIGTRLHDAADLPQKGDRTGRLVSICQALGATCYLSGPSARSYLDETQFLTAGITVEWMTYPAYPAYRQMDGGYEAGVSILDCLAHLPPEKVF
jgi:hypothetical protein